MLAVNLLLIALVGQASSLSTESARTDPAVDTITKLSVPGLRHRAEAGDSDAQNQLGDAYATGKVMPEDDTLAFAWYKKAAEKGNAAAENSLGTMYRLGRGVEKNKEEAVSWYRKATKLGSPAAMFNLGTCYYNGDGVPEDPITAYAWFMLAQEQGAPAAEDAVRRSSTELGQYSTSEAILRIGDMYEKGEDLPQSNADATRWYRKGSDESPEIALRLAESLIKGVKPDYVEAMDLCRKIANKRYAAADYCVGYLYQHGLGVTASQKEAAKWYGQGAVGDARAALSLAEMRLKGEGVPVDHPEAYYLLYLAYKGGVPGVRSQAHSLRQEMSKKEAKRLDETLRRHFLDPTKVYAIVDNPAPDAPTRQALPVIR